MKRRPAPPKPKPSKRDRSWYEFPFIGRITHSRAGTSITVWNTDEETAWFLPPQAVQSLRDWLNREAPP